MSDDRLEKRLDALADPPAATPLPASLRAAVGDARRRTIASTSLLASLPLASAALVVALSVDRDEPVIDRGTHEFVSSDAARPLSVASLRTFDPFEDQAFPGERSSPASTVRAVRLAPLTAERLDRILAGEL